MIRVLHVVGKMHRAGQETITMNLYRAIDRTQVQFDFLVHTEQKCDYDDEILRLGGRIHAVQKISKGIVRYVRAIEKIVRENHYDIVHLHTAHAAGFFVLLAAKRGGARVRIAHSRNNSAELALLHRALRPLIRFYSTDRFACSTQAGKWMFGENGDFIVKRNAIDTARFAFDPAVREGARQALSIAPDTLVVGHVGRLTKQKNHPFLLAALRALKQKVPDFTALLVGDGEDKDALVALCQEMGITDNVRFLGARSDVPALLQAMDAFVFPSLYEGFGNVVIEAQAAGLPCIVADTLTTETRATDIIQYLPLTLPPEGWAQAIMDRPAPERARYAALVAQAGFDIAREAKAFQDFYISAAARSGQTRRG